MADEAAAKKAPAKRAPVKKAAAAPELEPSQWISVLNGMAQQAAAGETSEMIHFQGRFLGQTMGITGAAQGIGYTVARRAALEGARLCLIDRAELIHEVAAELTELSGQEVFATTADLETWEGAEACAAFAKEKLGRLDIWINNVGGTIWSKPYIVYPPDQIEKEINRSLYPSLWCCRAVAPYMVEQREGVIVNVSSVATKGLMRVPYGAAKSGVNSLTANLAWELAEYNVRVCATAPGATQAPPRKIQRGPQAQTEEEKVWYQTIFDQSVASSLMTRQGTLEEQAAPILFLASKDAGYITGTRLPVAGGDLG